MQIPRGLHAYLMYGFLVQTAGLLDARPAGGAASGNVTKTGRPSCVTCEPFST